MSLIQWGSLDDLSTLRETMDELCEVPFARRRRARALAPGQLPVDAFETEDEFIVLAELPGIDPSHVVINVTDKALTIKAEAKREYESVRCKCLRRELRRGSFIRSLALPSAVNGDQIKASYKDGILEIRVPKIKPVKSRVQVRAVAR